MSFRFGLAVSSVACAAALSFSGVAAEDMPPTFWVESSHLEVGPVTAGTVAVASFVFHNDGDGEVQIVRAAPS